MLFQNLEKEIKKRGISKMKLACMALINTGDLYCALNGKKPMFPSWKKRIAYALQMPVLELFPECKDRKGA